MSKAMRKWQAGGVAIFQKYSQNGDHHPDHGTKLGIKIVETIHHIMIGQSRSLFVVGYDLLLEKLVNHHIKRVDNWQCWDMLRLEMPKCRSQWSPGTSHWWAFQRHTARMPHVAELESLEPPSVGTLHVHQIKSVKRLYTLEMLGDHSASYRSYRQT